MSFSEDIGVGGRVAIEVRDPMGQVVDERRVKNLVTIEGRKALGQLLGGAAIGDASGKMKQFSGNLFMAVGTGKASPALLNTALGAETARTLANRPLSLGVEDDRVILRVNATFDALTGTAVQELTEAGMLLEVLNGDPVLFNRVTFPVVSRSSGLQISLSWEVLF